MARRLLLCYLQFKRPLADVASNNLNEGYYNNTISVLHYESVGKFIIRSYTNNICKLPNKKKYRIDKIIIFRSRGIFTYSILEIGH